MIKFNFHMLIVVMSLQRVVLPRVSILVLLLTCEELKSVKPLHFRAELTNKQSIQCIVGLE